MTYNFYDNADAEPLIAEALNRIYSDYGVRTSVRVKAKSLLKFGRNPNVGTSLATIWYTGQDDADETYAADNTNSIDTISSSDAGDTEIVTVEGHTMSGGDKTFVTQPATLNGQNKVTLTTALNRVTRVYHAGQSDTDLVGEVYVYEDTGLTGGKPTDTTKIHLTVPAGLNQSEKASTSLSSIDYWILTSMRASILEKTTNIFADVRLEVRLSGGVFRPREQLSVSSAGGTVTLPFAPYLVIPANADARLRAFASAGGTDVTASMQGFLATIYTA